MTRSTVRPLPAADTFMILFPDAFAEDPERCHALAAQMEATYPGLRFTAVQSQSIRPENGFTLGYSEPTLVPLMGTAGEGEDPASQRSRPTAATMSDMSETLRAFVRGAAALN